MQNNKITYREIVSRYVDTWCMNQNLTDDADPAQVKEIVVNKLVDEFEQEIKEKYVHELYDEVKNKLKYQFREENEKQKRKQIITFLIETVILSGIVGLIVNQVTELLNTAKPSDSNNIVTLILIMIFLFVLVLFILFMYLNKLNDILEQKISEFSMDDVDKE